MSLRTIFRRLIGITSEFSTGDKIITWSIFLYSIVYGLFGTFLLVILWTAFSPWKLAWWGNYFCLIYLAVPILCAMVATFWFVIGGIFDMKRLFRDLQKRVDDPLDNGQVEGEVSLADQKKFAEQESPENPEK